MIATKQELSKVDVLVCGLCHIGFHFVEEFQEHKVGDACKKVSAFRDQNTTVIVLIVYISCYYIILFKIMKWPSLHLYNFNSIKKEGKFCHRFLN